jgi:Spy/CpxP family protein refolding chaperone
MMEPDPAHMFRGLPLTAEQDSEIRHYIHGRLRSHLPWDTPELRAMLADMLHPPEIDEEDMHALSDSMDKERTAVILDGGKDRDKADPSPES